MKIEIEIPDWCGDKNVYVLAGIELAAYKRVGEPWKIKVSRCHECGGCCIFRDGPCVDLIADGKAKRVCGKGLARPTYCTIIANAKNVEGCTEKFE